MSTKNSIPARSHDVPENSLDEFKAIPARVDIQERIEAVLLGTKRSTGADGIAVSLKEGEAFVCRASVGMAPEIGVAVEPGQGICGRCAVEARTIIDQELEGDIQSVVAVPVINNGTAFGLVAAFSIQKHAFTAASIQNIHHLAEVIKNETGKPAIAEVPTSPEVDVVEDLLSALKIVPPEPNLDLAAFTEENDRALTELVADILEHIPPEAVQDIRPRAPERSTEDVLMEVVDHTPKPAASPAQAAVAAAPKKIEKTPVAPVPEKKSSTVIAPKRATHDISTKPPESSEDVAADNRARIIVMSIVAVLLLLLVAYFVFLRKGTTPEPKQVSAAVPTSTASAPAPNPTNPAPTPSSNAPEKKIAAKTNAAPAEPRSSSAPAAPLVVEGSTIPRRVAAAEEPPPVSLSSSGRGISVPDIPSKTPDIVFGGQRSMGAIPARLLQKVDPTFPAMARSMRLSGDVRLEALVGADGRVKNVRQLGGQTILSSAAADAVRKWRYEPAKQNGKNVESTVEITIRFR